MNNTNIPKIKRKIDKLLLCGGGFKFYYLYGSIKYLHEINILQNIKEYIGISAGAIICLLFSLGYKPKELNKFIMEFKFDKLVDPHLDNLLEKRGLDDGEMLKIAIQQFLIKKNYNEDITFKELFEKTNKRLVFIASNITKNELELINCITYPNMKIWEGILITTALPILFEPILYNDNYLIDGGVFDNYPIDLFINDIDKDQTILGINLAAHVKNIDFNLDFFNYITKLFLISHHWKNINKINKYRKYTIEIKTYDTSELLNTEISTDEKERRILHGYDSAQNHFEKYEIIEEPEESEELEESEESEESEKNINVISEEEILKKVSEINYVI
jgi:NTE family protein